MLRIVWFGVAAVIGCGLATGDAGAAAIRCDTCRVDRDFRAEAVKMGAGTHLVYNLRANMIQQYYVGHDSTDAGGGEVTRAVRSAGPVVQRETPPAPAVEQIRRGNGGSVEVGGTLRPTYFVPVDMLGLNPDARSRTAYDYVRDQNLRGMVESAVGNVNVISQVVGGHGLTAATDLPRLAANDTGFRDLARPMFKVIFKDGSFVMIAVNPEHQNGESEQGSERTAAGQFIPSDLQGVEGTWTDHGGENLARMATHMASLGATMTSSGPSGGSVKAITCSGTAAAKTCAVEYRIR
ncbi:MULTISPECIES: hypothetical protein [unclassified Stenotrophomonas]|uniref:hypothetical protein n=1 Tax=unclassified Stenotrophomonas TaxID=196198 RepID=UPI0021182CD0|nr:MULTISPECIES: hypothetical protein [unclassified Stenotrophomonas]